MHIRAFVKEGWVQRETGKQGAPRLQFNQFQLLHDVLDSMTKRITFQTPIEGIDQKFINTIVDLTKKFKGKKSVHLAVFDQEKNVHLTMPSRTAKIDINRDLIKTLSEHRLNYKLN